MALSQEELQKAIFEFLEEKYGISGVWGVEEEGEYDSYRTQTEIWYTVDEYRFNHRVIGMPPSEILELE